MTLRSGLASQIGFIAEVTYGTYIAPTRFLEFEDESLKLDVQHIEGKGLRTGNRVLRQDRQAINKKGATGDINFEVASKGFGLLFKHMLGSNVVSTPGGATLAREHTCTIADPFGLSLTTQVGRPDVSGVVQPFSYLGCKVSSWEITNDIDGLLMLKLSLDAQDETTAQTLAAASFAASDEIFPFTEGVITVGGSPLDVTKFSLSGDNGFKTDRYFIRGNTLKKEPLAADLVKLTGSLDVELDGLTAYGRIPAGTVAAVTAKWTGSIIETTLHYAVEITLPAVRFDGDTPNVGGPDVVTHSLPFTVLNDGTNPPVTLVYRTTDTAA